MTTHTPDFEAFKAYLTLHNHSPASRVTFVSSVRRILKNVPDLTEEHLTDYFYTLSTGVRNNLRSAWTRYREAMAAQGATLPTPAYRGKGLALAGKVKQKSVDGLRRHHASMRRLRHERENPLYGRIMLQTTDGATFVGDLTEDKSGQRIILDRAVIMQGETLAKLPGRVSIPVAREAYRVLVPNDAYLGAT